MHVLMHNITPPNSRVSIGFELQKASMTVKTKHWIICSGRQTCPTVLV